MIVVDSNCPLSIPHQVFLGAVCGLIQTQAELGERDQQHIALSIAYSVDAFFPAWRIALEHVSRLSAELELNRQLHFRSAVPSWQPLKV